MLKRSALVIGVMSLLLMLVGFASANSYDLQGRTVYIGGRAKTSKKEESSTSAS